MHTPKLRHKLMSGPALDSMGTFFSCKNGRISLFSNNGKKVFTAIKANGFFICKSKYPNVKNKTLVTAETKIYEENINE